MNTAPLSPATVKRLAGSSPDGGGQNLLYRRVPLLLTAMYWVPIFRAVGRSWPCPGREGARPQILMSGGWVAFPQPQVYKFKTKQNWFLIFYIAELSPEGKVPSLSLFRCWAKELHFLRRRSIIAQDVRARPVGGAGGGADWGGSFPRLQAGCMVFHVLLFLLAKLGCAVLSLIQMYLC